MEQLDFIIAASLQQILTGDLARQVALIEDKLIERGDSLGGRQLMWLINSSYHTPHAQAHLLTQTDIMCVALKGDNLGDFVYRWELCLQNITHMPDDETLRCLFERQVERSEQFAPTLKLMNLDRVNNGVQITYQRLLSQVKTYLADRQKKKRQ